MVIVNKGNNKITELRTILQRESQNSQLHKQTKSANNRKTVKTVTHNIYRSLESAKDVCAIFLDVSKVFDKVWHEGLIFKLRQFGITGTLISLLENYLTDRSQIVVLNSKTPPSQSISAGVLQGSSAIFNLC
jgi:hypothetical protein